MTQREVATMKDAGYHCSLRAKRIRLGRSGFREMRPPRIRQGLYTNLAMTGRDER